MCCKDPAVSVCAEYKHILELPHIQDHAKIKTLVLSPTPFQMCASHQWGTLRLDGSCAVKTRQSLVDQFNDPTDPSFIFLLSSKAGGVGLNIIGANRLVLFDGSWNPAEDLQVGITYLCCEISQLCSWFMCVLHCKRIS